MLTKDPVEVREIVEPYLGGDIHYAFVAIEEEGLGLLDPIAVQIFPGREAQFLVKDVAEIIFAHAGRGGNFLAGKGPVIVLVEIGEGVFDDHACLLG